jgi:hypothetical protein
MTANSYSLLNSSLRNDQRKFTSSTFETFRQFLKLIATDLSNQDIAIALVENSLNIAQKVNDFFAAYGPYAVVSPNEARFGH